MRYSTDTDHNATAKAQTGALQHQFRKPSKLERRMTWGTDNLLVPTRVSPVPKVK